VLRTGFGRDARKRKKKKGISLNSAWRERRGRTDGESPLPMYQGRKKEKFPPKHTGAGWGGKTSPNNFAKKKKPFSTSSPTGKGRSKCL